MALSRRLNAHGRRSKLHLPWSDQGEQRRFAMAATGKKICTIRRGTARVEGDMIDLTNGKDRLRVRILSVQIILYRDLTDEHARWEGFAGIEELRNDLATYYRAIEDQQPVTIIKFER